MMMKIIRNKRRRLVQATIFDSLRSERFVQSISIPGMDQISRNAGQSDDDERKRIVTSIRFKTKHRTCDGCNLTLPLNNFDYNESICKLCASKKTRLPSLDANVIIGGIGSGKTPIPVHTLRTCRRCGNRMPLIHNFEISQRSVCGTVYRKWACKQCRREQARYRSHIKRRINLDKYIDTPCPVCERRMQRNGSIRMCIDHCHKTGKLRGIICNDCNSAIGKLGDSVETLTKALDYLVEAENKKKKQKESDKNII